MSLSQRPAGGGAGGKGDARAEREKKKRKEKQLRTRNKPKTAGEIHVTLVGDKGASKTTILKSFAQDATNEFSGPFETVAYPVTIAGAKEPRYVLRLFDTDSDELFSRIRAITYKTTDLFLVCFDLTNEDTFKNARSWYAEVNQLSSKIPVILVGTKADKVGDVKVNRRLADSMREDAMMIYNYVEVDASDPQHVKKLLDLAVSYLAL